MDYSSCVRGISQARTLEQVAISFSGESSRPRDWTHISCVSCIHRQILYTEPPLVAVHQSLSRLPGSPYIWVEYQNTSYWYTRVSFRNICVQVFVWTYTCISLRLILKSGMTWSYDQYFFKLFIALSNCLQSDCIIKILTNHVWEFQFLHIIIKMM